MPDALTIVVNGATVTVPPGAMVSTALLVSGIPSRLSVEGEPRFPVCGMGICFECRATINGVAHQRTCQLLCQPGMIVETGR